MNGNDIDQSQDLSSPESSGDHEISRKRQKLEESNASSLSSTDNDSVRETEEELECILLKIKLESLHARLSQSGATPSECYQIRKEIEEIFKLKKSALLRIQLKVNANGIEQLRRTLEATMRSNQELLRALMIAYSKMCMLKTAMKRTIRALLIQIYHLRTRSIPPNSEEDSASEKSQEDDREVLERTVGVAKGRIDRLQHMLESNLINQTEFDLQNIELEQAQRTILKLQTVERIEWESNSRSQNGFNCQEKTPENVNYERPEISPGESTSTNDSEEELRSSQNIISTLHGAVEVKKPSEEQILTLQKISEDAEEVEQVMRLEENFEELYSRLYDHQSSDSGTSSAASKQETSAPQQTETVSLEERENLSVQIDHYETRESQCVSLEHEYWNPDDNDFPWYVPNIDDGLPAQNIDVGRFGDYNVDRDSEMKASVPAGMIEICPDWLLTPEASSSAVSNEDSPSIAPYENNIYSSPDTNDEESQSSEDSNVMEIGNEIDPLDAFKLMVGKNFVLVSHSRFFQIDWRNECEHIGGNQWFCKNCPQTERWRPRIEDHVWITHYGEIFKCPYCPFNSERNKYRSRSFIRGHLKSKHPHLLEEI